MCQVYTRTHTDFTLTKWEANKYLQVPSECQAMQAAAQPHCTFSPFLRPLSLSLVASLSASSRPSRKLLATVRFFINELWKLLPSIESCRCYFGEASLSNLYGNPAQLSSAQSPASQSTAATSDQHTMALKRTDEQFSRVSAKTKGK